MLKPISPTMHGAIDYATVFGTMAAPKMLKMPPRAAGLAYGLAAAIMGLAAFTDFKPGIKRTVPLKVHGITDSALGLPLPALPWMMGFARNKKARNFFLGLTGMVVLTTALTDWTPSRKRRLLRR